MFLAAAFYRWSQRWASIARQPLTAAHQRSSHTATVYLYLHCWRRTALCAMERQCNVDVCLLRACIAAKAMAWRHWRKSRRAVDNRGRLHYENTLRRCALGQWLTIAILHLAEASRTRCDLRAAAADCVYDGSRKSGEGGVLQAGSSRLGTLPFPLQFTQLDHSDCQTVHQQTGEPSCSAQALHEVIR